MKSFNVCIMTIENAKKFVNAASIQDFDIDMVTGRYQIDAKSIMGIFSLDLSQSTTVYCHCEDENKIRGFKNLIQDMIA